MKKNFFPLLLAVLLLTLTGCRSRTTLSPRGAEPPTASETVSDGLSADSLPEETDDGAETIENPSAEKKEYDETARAELLTNPSQAVHGEGDGEGLPLAQRDAENHALQLSSAAALTATQTLPADEAERLGVSESAPAAETAQRYYAALLQTRLNTLFECKKLNVYIETPAAFVTVYKTSAEHALILAAGGYDVAAKRMENDLTVDGGWVQRKNPDFIVKFAAPDALAGHVQGLCDALLAREGIRETSAGKNRRVLLLSEAFLSAPQLQTAAAVGLAKAMYPDLFDDIDAAQAVGQLADECGADPGTLLFAQAS